MDSKQGDKPAAACVHEDRDGIGQGPPPTESNETAMEAPRGPQLIVGSVLRANQAVT